MTPSEMRRARLTAVIWRPGLAEVTLRQMEALAGLTPAQPSVDAGKPFDPYGPDEMQGN